MSLIMPVLMPWLYQTMMAMAEGRGENRRTAYRDDVNNLRTETWDDGPGVTLPNLIHGPATVLTSLSPWRLGWTPSP